jgi:hypothetical protein
MLDGIFGPAVKIVGGFVAVLAALAVLWFIDILFGPAPHPANFLAGAGAGLKVTFQGVVSFLKSL